jgi:hypothetical protein
MSILYSHSIAALDAAERLGIDGALLQPFNECFTKVDADGVYVETTFCSSEGVVNEAAIDACLMEWLPANAAQLRDFQVVRHSEP